MNAELKDMTRTLYFETFHSPSLPMLSRLLTGPRMEALKSAGVRSVRVISSVPVEALAYRSLLQWYEAGGFRVHSHHVDGLSMENLRSIKGAVRELAEDLREGNCLVVSYGRSVAASLIACLHAYLGKSPGEALEMVRDLRTEAHLPENEADFISAFLDFADGTIESDPGKKTRRSGSIKGPTVLRSVLFKVPGLPAARSGAIRDAIPVPKEVPAPARRHEPPVYPEEPVSDKEPGPVPDIDISYGDVVTVVPSFEDESPSERFVLRPEEEVRVEQAPEVPRPEEPVRDKKEPFIPASEARGETTTRPGPFYTSLRFKLITIISVIIILSLSGMIFLATYFFEKDNRVRVEENNLNISEVVSMKAESDIESFIKRSRAVASSLPAVRNVPGGESSLLRDDPDLLLVAMLSRRPGTTVYDVTSSMVNTPLLGKYQVTAESLSAALKEDADLLSRAFLGETVVRNISPALGVPVIVLALPYGKDEINGITSVLVSCVSLDSLQKAFQSRGGITTVFMVNDRADIIAHPDGKIVVSGGNYTELPIITMMMKSKLDNGQMRYRDEKGVFHIGSFKKTGIGGLGVIATVEENRAFQEVYNIQRRNIYIMVIMLTVVIMVIFYFGKSITNPIILLLNATKRIKEGIYQVDIKPTSKDEIGDLTTSFIEMGKGLQEREKIKSAFGKFVNKDIVAAAMREELVLGGERKTVAILFSDIRSFTAISEKLQPEEVVEFLNEYMTRMVGCVNATFGVVDKFIGDAIMAVWGTPASKGNDTENCVRCALLMRGELFEYNRTRGPGKPALSIGIGISTGPVLAGQIGSEDRMEYTVIGDTVNLASRIESLNKTLGTDLIISEDSYNLVKDLFAVEKMQTIKVRGKEKPQQLYVVLGLVDDPARPKSVEELRKLVGTVERPADPSWDERGSPDEGEGSHESLKR